MVRDVHAVALFCVHVGSVHTFGDVVLHVWRNDSQYLAFGVTLGASVGVIRTLGALVPHVWLNDSQRLAFLSNFCSVWV